MYIFFVKNALSVDLEEWFCGHILAQGLSKKTWDTQELRVPACTAKLLKILDLHKTRATFFVLGWLAERAPELIREVADHGHEIASHGYSHISLTEMTPDEFNEDLKKSLQIIKGISKNPILGYRAPSFTITKETTWAFEIMSRHGISYDSSVFPFGLHPDYGIRDSPLGIYKISSDILEVPLSVAEVMRTRIPCGGGGYFRLYPYAMTRSLFKRCNKERRPVVFYLHPWELDAEQPRVSLSCVNKFRHYHNLEKVSLRLERLLDDFQFTTIREVIGI